jgi:DNA-binding CsgD family transcriptional regulator
MRLGVDVFRVAFGGEELLVVSLPSTRLDVSGLTAAERAVASDAALGLSNLEIARRRRRSQRTIANQLASAFRKLGVSSRSGLVARFARAHAD